MQENERMELIKNFLNREDLTGTDLRLKEKISEVDQRMTVARAENKKLKQELQNIQIAANNKAVEVMSLAERLDSLCELAIDLEISKINDQELEEK